MNKGDGPLVVRNFSFLSSKEIHQIISDLKISKVTLSVEDIEMILDTLVFDGKVEMSMEVDQSMGEQMKTYRAVEKLLSSAGVVRIPCGVCPVCSILLALKNLRNNSKSPGYSVVRYCGLRSTQNLSILRSMAGLNQRNTCE